MVTYDVITVSMITIDGLDVKYLDENPWFCTKVIIFFFFLFFLKFLMSKLQVQSDFFLSVS